MKYTQENTTTLNISDTMKKVPEPEPIVLGEIYRIDGTWSSYDVEAHYVGGGLVKLKDLASNTGYEYYLGQTKNGEHTLFRTKVNK